MAADDRATQGARATAALIENKKIMSMENVSTGTLEKIENFILQLAL